ncbi:MAG: nuclear transport factor 2 family protein [Bacteroidota bacterium]
MQKFTFIFMLVLLIGCTSYAQKNNPMEKAVKSTLAQYLQAGDQNDSEALDPHMHAAFRVALYDGKEDIVKTLDRETYRTLIGNKTFGGYPRTADYQSIHFIGAHMATVQVVLTSPGKPTLKNFYSLAKVGAQWQVIQDFVTMVPVEK